MRAMTESGTAAFAAGFWRNVTTFLNFRKKKQQVQLYKKTIMLFVHKCNANSS